MLSFDQDRWIPARDNFLFPVKALSIVFRRKFLKLLEKAFDQGKLHFPGKTAPLAYPRNFHVTAQTIEKETMVRLRPKSLLALPNICSTTSAATSTASLYPTIESYRSTMGGSPSLTGIEKTGTGSRP